MHYEFPVIKTIDDVEPYIDENFLYQEKDDYVVINYILGCSKTFPHDTELSTRIRREFRGITFGKDSGLLIRRPFHKFFNHMERPSTMFDLDLSKVLTLEKLDGSMIAPFYSQGQIVWGTRAGKTDFSDDVEKFINLEWFWKTPEGEFKRRLLKDIRRYRDFAHWAITEGYTPIFEWVSPTNRIVVSYPEPSLVLTAMRHMETGKYVNYDALKANAAHYNIPCIGTINHKSLKMIRDSSDSEGVVVRFDDGHMVKVKSVWYCALHKLKNDLQYEKDVIRLILDGKHDDLLPFLLDHDRDKLVKYADQLIEMIDLTAWVLRDIIVRMRNDNWDRKMFALSDLGSSIGKFRRTIIFQNWDNRTEDDDVDMTKLNQSIMDLVRSNLISQTRVDSIREFIGPPWTSL